MAKLRGDLLSQNLPMCLRQYKNNLERHQRNLCEIWNHLNAVASNRPEWECNIIPTPEHVENFGGQYYISVQIQILSVSWPCLGF